MYQFAVMNEFRSRIVGLDVMRRTGSAASEQTPKRNNWSTPKKKRDMMATMINTMMVEIIVSLRDVHVTLEPSAIAPAEGNSSGLVRFFLRGCSSALPSMVFEAPIEISFVRHNGVARFCLTQSAG